MRPHRRQPTRLPRPWDPPGKNTGVGCHFHLQGMKVKSENEVAQSCLTLSDPMDCSLPGSSVNGIFQARGLEWCAIAFSSAWKWKVKVKSLSHVWLLSITDLKLSGIYTKMQCLYPDIAPEVIKGHWLSRYTEGNKTNYNIGKWKLLRNKFKMLRLSQIISKKKRPKIW